MKLRELFAEVVEPVSQGPVLATIQFFNRRTEQYDLRTAHYASEALALQAAHRLAGHIVHLEPQIEEDANNQFNLQPSQVGSGAGAEVNYAPTGSANNYSLGLNLAQSDRQGVPDVDWNTASFQDRYDQETRARDYAQRAASGRQNLLHPDIYATANTGMGRLTAQVDPTNSAANFGARIPVSKSWDAVTTANTLPGQGLQGGIGAEYTQRDSGVLPKGSTVSFNAGGLNSDNHQVGARLNIPFMEQARRGVKR
jgi:hypothetical protein